MTFLVPYDGSELAEAALVRADEYADALDEDVTAVTVVPESKRYAREKEWIDAGYDVHLVRRREPPAIESIRHRSEFYLTE